MVKIKAVARISMADDGSGVVAAAAAAMLRKVKPFEYPEGGWLVVTSTLSREQAHRLFQARYNSGIMSHAPRRLVRFSSILDKETTHHANLSLSTLSSRSFHFKYVS